MRKDRRTSEHSVRHTAGARIRRRLRNITIGMIMVLCASTTCGVFLVSAHGNTPSEDTLYTYYKSIEIQPGDTLWGIAEETMTSAYNSTAEYVQVLKDINNLQSDDIQSGQYLIIQYEDTKLLP